MLIERDNIMRLVAMRTRRARVVMTAQHRAPTPRVTSAEPEVLMSNLAQNQGVRAVGPGDSPVPARARGATRWNGDQRTRIDRGDVVARLVFALGIRFPVVEQLVGVEFFHAMARAYLTEAPPDAPILLSCGDTFPAFIDRFAPAKPAPYLGDIARIELARGLAYHAADVAPIDAAAFGSPPLEQFSETRFRLHPSVAIVMSQYPAFSIWRVNQNPDRVVPISPWAPEATLIARPFLRVETCRLSVGAARFIQALINGATLGAAVAAGSAAAPMFNGREALALLIASDIVVGFDRHMPPSQRPQRGH